VMLSTPVACRLGESCVRSLITTVLRMNECQEGSYSMAGDQWVQVKLRGPGVGYAMRWPDACRRRAMGQRCVQ
jgi:hypothetical protein